MWCGCCEFFACKTLSASQWVFNLYSYMRLRALQLKVCCCSCLSLSITEIPEDSCPLKDTSICPGVMKNTVFPSSGQQRLYIN